MTAVVTAVVAPPVPLARLEALAGPDGFVVTVVTDGVVTGRLGSGATEVAAFATDAAARGGALGPVACDAIVDLIDGAVRDGLPVVALWHSAGASLDGGLLSLAGVGRVFAAITRASGRVPQVAVVLGPSAGGAAYGSGLADVVVMSEDGRMFVTGPSVVREATGEHLTSEQLGGPALHATLSGVAHLTAPDDRAALLLARSVVDLLRGASHEVRGDDAPDHGLVELVPRSSRQAYDVRPVVTRLLDPQTPPVELQPGWAANVVTTLGRVAGRPVGVVANNPAHQGGCLDADASDKAARFVRLCDAFGLPLVVLVDVPGYLPGRQQEEEAVLRRGAKLLHAFAAATVPSVTVHTRKAYGGAYIAMNSRALGATTVLAWPSAELAIMGPQAAVQVLHGKELAALPPRAREDAVQAFLAASPPEDGLAQAVAAGLVDRVVDPATTRSQVARAVRGFPYVRAQHANIPL